ncbi:hypothetical protein P154DRAFT_55751 [Amniculicola lignicola CBS 123094]|uniref:Transmembrane protein n=1 Tax=Amniculicola lignicola CBS 123094 TaxID=1392246 RepID=A0A6A5WT83_9PLEO|nr:hypothetical protein P154DRAFT_55751 [Amniculicola lignicola CBS 123094]
MGIPYSREINTVFEQVTPLVAAGFKVLKTTKNISIVLAVIQVLTVVFLAMILAVLVALVYCVDPGLEYERKTLVTPFFRSLARITLWDIVTKVVGGLVACVSFSPPCLSPSVLCIPDPTGIISASLFLTKGRQYADIRRVEHEGDEEANRALSELEGEKEEKEVGKKGKAKGKGKKNKGEEEGV